MRELTAAIDRHSSVNYGVRYRLSILGLVTYALYVACTGTITDPTALGVPYDNNKAVRELWGLYYTCRLHFRIDSYVGGGVSCTAVKLTIRVDTCTCIYRYTRRGCL